MDLREFLEWAENYHFHMVGSRLQTAANSVPIAQTFNAGAALLPGALPAIDATALIDYCNTMHDFVLSVPLATDPGSIDIGVIQRLLAALP